MRDVKVKFEIDLREYEGYESITLGLDFSNDKYNELRNSKERQHEAKLLMLEIIENRSDLYLDDSLKTLEITVENIKILGIDKD